MPRFRQTAEILKLMAKKESIRNLGMVAHIDHGKTTTTDSLLVEAGLLSPKIAGTARVLDYLEEEQRRGITIKTANISLLHDSGTRQFVVNLVDTPGHVDFTGKVTRALRATDGVIVVVDAVEEVMAQTETVTRQALEERVKPVLFINKVDRLVEELKLNADDIQRKFSRIIGEFNNLIELYGEPKFKDHWRADPSRDNVVFGSALHRWGFTVRSIHEKGMNIKDIMGSCSEGKHEDLSELLPLHKAILDTIIQNIPSPIDAQRYRIPRIWKGTLQSEVGRAMLRCDEEGPTTACITNIQTGQNLGTIATGRIFSGSIKEGARVFLIDLNKELPVGRVTIYMGSYREAVPEISAGNIAALEGLGSARAGETLVDVQHKDAMTPFEHLKYVSEPIATVAVEPRNPEDLPSLIKAMHRLALEDPNIAISTSERTGEYSLSGTGELHLEIATTFLKDYSGGIEFTMSKPAADYRESVAQRGSIVSAKSLNKKNSFQLQVESMKSNAPESGEVDESGIVWIQDEHLCTLVDSTENADYLAEVKDSIISGFRWACKTGPLCEQPLTNIKVRLASAQIHEDPAEREPTQIARATSRAIYGSFLTAKPVLLEPVYKIVLSLPTKWIGACSKILARRRGKILATEHRNVSAIVTGYIPVAETFGLSAEIRSATSGYAYWQCTFDHWETLPPALATEVIHRLRMQKGLSPEIPTSRKFIDRG